MKLWKRNGRPQTDDIDRHPMLRGLKFACENETFKTDEFYRITGLTEDHYGQSVLQDIATIRGPGQPGQELRDHIFAVKYEAFIHYLDYIELKEARSSSERAMRVAIAAIGISILIGVISILISINGDTDHEYYPSTQQTISSDSITDFDQQI